MRSMVQRRRSLYSLCRLIKLHFSPMHFEKFKKSISKKSFGCSCIMLGANFDRCSKWSTPVVSEASTGRLLLLQREKSSSLQREDTHIYYILLHSYCYPATLHSTWSCTSSLIGPLVQHTGANYAQDINRHKQYHCIPDDRPWHYWLALASLIGYRTIDWPWHHWLITAQLIGPSSINESWHNNWP